MQATSQQLIIAREFPAIPTYPFIISTILGFALLALSAMYHGQQERLLAEESYNKTLTDLAKAEEEKERTAAMLAYAQSKQGRKELAQTKLNYHARNEIVVIMR
ncbi:MAG: hypothetical protein JST84_05355 [Acidobacteria bacterium]|nr:hypothetical protein [Acidobacteriota bacterium]